MNRQTLGRLSLFLIAIIWGLGFVVCAVSVQIFTPFQTMALRFPLAFGLAALIFHKKLRFFTKTKFLLSARIGILMFLALIFQVYGLVYTTAPKSAFLTATYIVMLPFLSYLLIKRPMSMSSLVGAFVALLGVGFLSYNPSGLTQFNLGDWLTLIGAVAFAFQLHYTEVSVAEVEPELIVVGEMGVCSLISWIGLIILGEFTFNWTMQGIGIIAYMGILNSLVAFIIQTFAARYVQATETAIILSTDIFFCVLFSWILLHEQLNFYMLIGAILIFLSIIIVQTNPFERMKEIMQNTGQKRRLK